MKKSLRTAAAAAVGIGFIFAAPTAQAVPSSCGALRASSDQLAAMGSTPSPGMEAQYAQYCAAPQAAPPQPASGPGEPGPHSMCLAEGMCNASGGPAGTPAAAPPPPAAAAPQPQTAPKPGIASPPVVAPAAGPYPCGPFSPPDSTATHSPACHDCATALGRGEPRVCYDPAKADVPPPGAPNPANPATECAAHMLKDEPC
jgi:hypothetical protein